MSDADLKLPIIRARDAWEYLLDRWGEFEPALLVHIATGGTLRSAAKNFAVPFPWLYKHIVGDPGINQKYQDAVATRSEFMKQFIYDEFKEISENPKVTLGYRIKALEMLAKHFKWIDVDKVDENGKLTWEQLIEMSNRRREEMNAARQVREQEVDREKHQAGASGRPSTETGGGHRDVDV